VREIRGRGLLLGIELDQAGAGARAAAAALREGLLVLPAGEQGEVVELTPSALIGDELLRWAAGALARALRRNPGA
jgi:putrescine aminotransferase